MIMATTQNQTHRIAEAFRYLVRFASLIWVIISSSILLYTIVSGMLISDEEYIFSQKRELQTCEQPAYVGDKSVELTAEQKATCVQETTDKILQTRAYDDKHTIILASSRLFVCAIVYLMFWNGTRRKND